MFITELGVEGASMKEVIDAAANAVGVSAGRSGSLREKARLVWVQLGSPPSQVQQAVPVTSSDQSVAV